MIEVKNLVKRYGDHVAVNNLSFTVEEGQIYGFLGPNGAGKSTTMNIITGYLASTEGEVLITGHNILEEPEEAKKCIGYLPEMPPLYFDMTVGEYMNFVADLKKIPKDQKKSMVEEVMEMVKITDMKNRLIKNLSKGYRQRVGLAQAILGYPEVIILDEPTLGLAPKQIIDIRDAADFEKETYPGAVYIYWEELAAHMDEIRKDCPVYLLCYTGQKSEEIAEELTEQGYEIYSIKNGYRAWLKMKLSKMMADHNAAEQRTKDILRSIIKKFRKPIWRRLTKAIRENELVQDGDKIAVCISGGKDSMLMAKLFQELKRHNKFHFDLVFLVMDPGYNEMNRQIIENNAKLLDIPITVFESDIFDAVYEIEKSPCYLCARMRRGYLYS